MAPQIPKLWLLVLISGTLAFSQQLIFPGYRSGITPTKIFLIFMGITSSLLVLWKTFIYSKWISPLRHLPQPKNGNPFYGHGNIVFKRPAGEEFLNFMNTVPNDGIISIPGFFSAHWLMVTDPRSIAEVLSIKSYDFEKISVLRDFLRIVIGNGLIVVEGEEHKFQRKHILPAFSFRHIKNLYPMFWSKATEMTRCVSGEIEESETNVVEINHWANKATMDIIGVAGMGRNFNTLNTSDDELINSYEEILEPTTEKAVYFTLNLFLPMWFVQALPWKLNKKFKRTTTLLRNLCRQLVREKKKQVLLEKDDHVDILSVLLRSGDFSTDMLAEQLLTFLAAGHETTSSAFTWGMYLLSKHPDIQTRLRSEIRADLPSPSTDPTIDLSTALESLPLLNGVCLEILRLYPSVPVTMRVASRNTTLLSTPVPKGTRVYIAPWAINRSPALWGPTAGDFDPDRWIDADGHANNHGGAKSNYSVLTFLHGPRACVGEKFAKAEMKALLSVFVGTFKMEMADPTEVPIMAGAITVKPKNGMHLRLTKVEGW